MKNILIIGSRDSGTKNDPVIMANSFGAAANCQVAYWEDMVFDIKTNDVNVRINKRPIVSRELDLVIAVGWYKSGRQTIYRDVAYSLALYLSHHNVEFWNREMIEQRSTSKLSTMVKLALSGVPVTESLFSISLKKLGVISLPRVIKAASASRGDKNFLVSTKEELRQIMADEGTFLVQPFLENDHDLRVICVGGDPQLVLERRRHVGADTHLNNTSQGGSAAWVEMSNVNSQLLTLSSKICTIMSRELAGIDFIPDESSPVGYSCLEVNAIPQLTSGVDVSNKLSVFSSAIINYLGEK